MLLRRTRLGILAAPQLRDAESVTPVAEAMGAELGWDEAADRGRGRGLGRDGAAEGVDPAADGVE